MRRVLALLMLVLILGGCAAEDEVPASAAPSYVVPIKGGQTVGMAAWEQITDGWMEEGGKDYTPDEFGGFYFAEDCHLVVKVLNGNEDFIEMTKSLVDDPSVLLFETTDISFNELDELNEEIFELVHTYGEFFDWSVGIDQKESAIVVHLQESEARKRENLYAMILLTRHDHVKIRILNIPTGLQND